jgi:hypothetical protein
MPSAVPIRKAMTVATPTRVMVHGRVCTSSEETDAGYWETSVPKLKWKISSRYERYWLQSEPGCPTPSSASSAL